jgi:hypothetical protein
MTRPDLLSRPLRLFIDGTWRPAASGRTIEVLNPSDGAVIAEMADGDARDVDAAVAAARRAFDGGPWPAATPAQRARLLWKLADLIDRHADELALLETLNTGKPLKPWPPSACVTTPAGAPSSKATPAACRCPANGTPTRCASRWAWPR